MTVETLFSEFKNKKVVVLGDLMVDAYLYGKVHRVSPEAPVPIINQQKKENRLGGAGNVALNLLSLGASVSICSTIGEDKEGILLMDLWKEKGGALDGIIQSKGRKTTVKTRVIGNQQQLLRIDQEQTDAISKEEEDVLLGTLEKLVQKGVDAIIFQDYNKGLLTQRVIKEAIALAKKHDVLTTVDPKLNNFFSYQGVDLFKPNLKELQEGLNITFDFSRSRSDFDLAVKELRKRIQPALVFVTLSELGVFIENGKEEYHIPAHHRTISDVSGAGDTVISVATLCLTANVPIEKLAAIANLSGGLVCEKAGVVAIQAEELKQEIERLQLV